MLLKNERMSQSEKKVESLSFVFDDLTTTNGEFFDVKLKLLRLNAMHKREHYLHTEYQSSRRVPIPSQSTSAPLSTSPNNMSTTAPNNINAMVSMNNKPIIKAFLSNQNIELH